MSLFNNLKSNKKSEILGLLLLSLAVIIFFALTSYNPLDTPAYTSAPNSPARNTVGVIGAYVAEGMFFSVGIGAYLLPAILLIWAWYIFRRKLGKEMYIKLIGLAMMLISVGALAQMFELSFHGARFRAGGIMGPYVSDLLGNWFGLLGARLVALTFFIVSTSIARVVWLLP